jgi:hypothetical protein
MSKRGRAAAADTQRGEQLSIKLTPEAAAHLEELRQLLQVGQLGTGEVTKAETIRRAVRGQLLAELARRADPTQEGDEYTERWLAVASNFHLDGEEPTEREQQVCREAGTGQEREEAMMYVSVCFWCQEIWNAPCPDLQYCPKCGHRADCKTAQCDCRQCQHERARGVLRDEQIVLEEEERRLHE